MAKTATLAPGSTKLVTAHSMPALPVPEITMVNSLAVPKQVFRPWRMSSFTWKKKGSRWPTMGCRMAS
ncbi:MAG: hypothetical protein QM757_31750 [Paludibaculum sp.]